MPEKKHVPVPKDTQAFICADCGAIALDSKDVRFHSEARHGKAIYFKIEYGWYGIDDVEKTDETIENSVPQRNG